MYGRGTKVCWNNAVKAKHLLTPLWVKALPMASGKTISNEISLSERNPVGRTGMVGRGLLGRWGPNHAADPVVTRYALVLYNCNGRLYVLQLIPRHQSRMLLCTTVFAES